MAETDWETLNKMLRVTFRPIDAWPGKPTSGREKSPFSANLKDTINLLKLSLNALQAREIVFQVAFQERHFRLDGLPRADATASHPGVILSFQSKHGPLRFAFDKFTRWDHNLRAVAMHLEHLRLASLYGVGSDGEAYRGWRALPAVGRPERQRSTAPPLSATPRAPVSAEEISAEAIAAGVLGGFSGISAQAILADVQQYKAAWRETVMLVHPDRGGDADAFLTVQRAAHVLNARFGLA